MTLGEINKKGSEDRLMGIPLSQGAAVYEKSIGDYLKLNEYIKGWTDMDTFLRMSSIVKEASKG